jgi:3-oxoacyl-[acyl-carrier protein] reductase
VSAAPIPAGPGPAPQPSFEGQVVAVTGGSRGIGRSVVGAFARAGADVVLNYASNRAAAEAAAEDVRAAGRRCTLVEGSVADPRLAEAVCRSALGTFGRIDVLVNNAGISRDGNVMMLSDAAWQEVLGVNLSGTFFCCRAVLPAMIAQGGGVILNMTSTAGLKGRAGQVTYAATKGAVIGLTKSLAQEYGRHGVRVNAIAPGFVETEMVAGLLARPGTSQAFLEATPLGRFGQPDDVASAALYLASPASAYVTGHVLLVNGGLFM